MISLLFKKISREGRLFASLFDGGCSLERGCLLKEIPLYGIGCKKLPS